MAIAFQADQYKWTHNLGFIIAHLDSYIWTSEGKSRSTKSQCLMSAELGYETIQQELLTIKHMLKITKKKPFTSLLNIKSWTKYRLPSKTILNSKVNEAWYITNKPTNERWVSSSSGKRKNTLETYELGRTKVYQKWESHVA